MFAASGARIRRHSRRYSIMAHFSFARLLPTFPQMEDHDRNASVRPLTIPLDFAARLVNEL